MRIELHDGRVINTDDHQCAGNCVFCSMNAAFAKDGHYAVPFDIPGVYRKEDRPHVIIVKLP